MAVSRRSYKGAPVSNTLGGSGLAQNATTINLASTLSGWPTGSEPFFVVVDPGTAKEEKVCVIYGSTTSLTVVDPAVTSAWSASVNGRGADDTTDRAHDAGAVIYPVFTAREANDANRLVSTYANQGGIVYQGSSNPAQLAIGTAGQVLKVNSGATAPEWGQIANAGIADDAVNAAKIVSGAVGIDELASAVINRLVPVGTIAAYAGITAPTGWLLCNGTSTTGYTALAALVGSTTPDMRGRFPLGDNASLDLLSTGGSTTIAEANLPSHVHTINHDHANTNTGGQSANHTHTFTESVFGTNLVVSPTDEGGSYLAGQPTGNTGINSNDHTHAVDIPAHTGNSGATGSGTAYFQPYLVVNYIIKHD